MIVLRVFNNNAVVVKTENEGAESEAVVLGPEVVAQEPVDLFYQGLMMQQVNSQKLIVEAWIEGSYEKALQAFTLNKTIPSMRGAKEVLDALIEANKDYWPELKQY